MPESVWGRSALTAKPGKTFHVDHRTVPGRRSNRSSTAAKPRTTSCDDARTGVQQRLGSIRHDREAREDLPRRLSDGARSPEQSIIHGREAANDVLR